MTAPHPTFRQRLQADCSQEAASTSYSMSHSLSKPSTLQHLWEQGELSDVTIKLRSDTLLPAHRIVLAAASQYFRVLFVGTGREMQSCSQLDSKGRLLVHLPDFDDTVVEAVVAAVYGRSLTVTPGNIEGLLAASSYLEVEVVYEACCQYLQSQLGVDSCLEILALAARYEATALVQEATVLACAHFSDVMARPGAIAALQAVPLAQVGMLLGADALEAGSEVEVLKAALAWLEGDTVSRCKDLPQLLAAVRMPTASLHHQLLAGLAGDTCSAAVRNAALEEVAQQHRSEVSVAALPPRWSMPTGLIVASGHDAGWRTLRTVEMYSPESDEWSTGPLMPHGFSFAGCAKLRNGLYVVGGATHESMVLRFDRKEQHWLSEQKMRAPRLHSAVAALPTRLYVMGGRADTTGEMAGVECFDADSRTWWAVASMNLPRTSLAAAALGGCIYAVGGQTGKSVHRTVESYDPIVDTWTVLPSQLLCARKYTSCAALGGRIFAVGGMTGSRTRLAAVEAYDPREGRWSALADMQAPRSSCGAAALHDQLYVAGGSGDDDVILDSVECYIPAAGKWMPKSPIGHGRTGLAMSAV